MAINALVVSLLLLFGPCVSRGHHLVVLVGWGCLTHEVGGFMRELLLVDQVMIGLYLFFLMLLHHLWINLHIRTLRNIITDSLLNVFIPRLDLLCLFYFLLLIFLFCFFHFVSIILINKNFVRFCLCLMLHVPVKAVTFV